MTELQGSSLTTAIVHRRLRVIDSPQRRHHVSRIQQAIAVDEDQVTWAGAGECDVQFQPVRQLYADTGEWILRWSRCLPCES